MSVVPSHPVVRGESSRWVPPLENGDRLTRAEFERRYAAMPDAKKAELIEGIVYMPSPVRITRHGRQHLLLAGWVSYFMAKRPEVDGGDNTTLRLDDDNEPQPDLMLRLPKESGGTSTVSDDGYVEGAVEFVAEVAASSVSLDMHRKLDVYRRHGVREYLVWRVEDAEVDWFVLRDGKYEPLKPTPDGVLKGEALAGLWLHVPALLAGDRAKLFTVIDEGVAAQRPR